MRQLDSLLREEQRRAPPDQLSRYRLLWVATSAQLLMAVLYLVSSLTVRDRVFHLRAASCAIVLYAITLVLVRKSASPFRPGVLLCAAMTGIYITTGLHVGDPSSPTHVATTLIPLLAFFLLGPRGGLAFSLPMVLYVLVLFPLFVGGVTPARELAASGSVFAASCILGVWGLSYLHSRARDKSQAALEQMLRNQGEGERRLSSILESTDDIVCSVDAQGRVLTANEAHQRWFLRLFGEASRVGEPLATPRYLQRHPDWPQAFARVMEGHRVRAEFVFDEDDTSSVLEFSLNPILGEEGRPVGVTLFGRDITARRQAEARLSELHRSLLESSRQAGMAEIATGVLHNVGNTLNSVNISASVLGERVRGLRLPGLFRAAEMLRDNSEDLATFLTSDNRGKRLTEYLMSSARQLGEDQAAMLAELESLTQSVDHIKSVVHIQQKHARVMGVVEEVTLPELLDDALRLHATSLDRLGIQIRRDYAPVPPIQVDRHKLLQILVNLLSNARHALLDSPHPEKQLTLRVTPRPGDRLSIEVSDNGIGISPENLARIFGQGFTTKKDGHGFGLHASALAAREMNGSLTCASDGPGRGATFTIELPLSPEASVAA